MTSFRLNYTGNEINAALGKAQTSIQSTDVATTEKAGLVKPDGITTTISSDGVISADVIDDTAASTTSTYSSSKIEEIVKDINAILQKLNEVSDRLLLLEK